MSTEENHTNDRQPHLCDTEWLGLYTEHIHVCIIRNRHTTPHQCECRTTKPVKQSCGTCNDPQCIWNGGEGHV